MGFGIREEDLASGSLRLPLQDSIFTGGAIFLNPCASSRTKPEIPPSVESHKYPYTLSESHEPAAIVVYAGPATTEASFLVNLLHRVYGEAVPKGSMYLNRHGLGFRTSRDYWLYPKGPCIQIYYIYFGLKVVPVWVLWGPCLYYFGVHGPLGCSEFWRKEALWPKEWDRLPRILPCRVLFRRGDLNRGRNLENCPPSVSQIACSFLLLNLNVKQRHSNQQLLLRSSP